MNVLPNWHENVFYTKMSLFAYAILSTLFVLTPYKLYSISIGFWKQGSRLEGESWESYSQGKLCPHIFEGIVFFLIY